MRKLFLLALLTPLLFACYEGAPYAFQEKPPSSVTIVLQWSPKTTYSKGEMATMPEFASGGPVYVSLQDGNTGIQPPSKIVSANDAWGNVGDQLPWIIPSPDWQNWWKLADITQ